jgi:hypothetical protein
VKPASGPRRASSLVRCDGTRRTSASPAACCPDQGEGPLLRPRIGPDGRRGVVAGGAGG